MSCLVKLFKLRPGLSLYTWAFIFIQGNEDRCSEYGMTFDSTYGLFTTLLRTLSHNETNSSILGIGSSRQGIMALQRPFTRLGVSQTYSKQGTSPLADMVAAVIAQLVKRFYNHPPWIMASSRGESFRSSKIPSFRHRDVGLEDKGQYTTKSKTVLSSRQDLSHENYES